MPSIEHRLLSRRYIDSHTGCWRFVGAKVVGYGVLSVSLEGTAKVVCAHVLAAKLWIGDAPIDKPYVLHTCDQRDCFNPGHLYYGTQRDNMRDAVVRGGIKVGSHNVNHRLSEEQVKEIKELTINKKETYRSIAKRFGVNPSTISRIAAGKRRTHG